MNYSSTTYRTLVLLIVLALTGARAASAKTFNLGLMGQEPGEDIRKLLPVANYLGKELEKEGFTQNKVVFAKTMNEVATLKLLAIKAQALDWSFAK